MARRRRGEGQARGACFRNAVENCDRRQHSSFLKYPRKPLFVGGSSAERHDHIRRNDTLRLFAGISVIVGCLALARERIPYGSGANLDSPHARSPYRIRALEEDTPDRSTGDVAPIAIPGSGV